MNDDKEVKPGFKPDEPQKADRSLEDKELDKNETPATNTAGSINSGNPDHSEIPSPEDTPENANTEGIP